MWYFITVYVVLLSPALPLPSLNHVCACACTYAHISIGHGDTLGVYVCDTLGVYVCDTLGVYVCDTLGVYVCRDHMILIDLCVYRSRNGRLSLWCPSALPPSC